MTRSEVYLCVCVAATNEQQDLLLGELTDCPVEGFEQRSEAICAYIDELDWSRVVEAEFMNALDRVGLGRDVTISRVEQRNWNAIWEAGIEPIEIGPFYISPSWLAGNPIRTGLTPIVIDPRMSFGTGHHESTRLMLVQLSQEEVRHDRVIDVGTGTGILAIAAVTMGATDVLAIDNDRWSIANARENVVQNGVADRIDLRLGSLELVAKSDYSLILANINRAALLTMTPAFKDMLAPRGRIILAGLLKADAAEMLNALTSNGWDIVTECSEGEWWSVKAELHV